MGWVEGTLEGKERKFQTGEWSLIRVSAGGGTYPSRKYCCSGGDVV